MSQLAGSGATLETPGLTGKLEEHFGSLASALVVMDWAIAGRGFIRAPWLGPASPKSGTEIWRRTVLHTGLLGWNADVAIDIRAINTFLDAVVASGGITQWEVAPDAACPDSELLLPASGRVPDEPSSELIASVRELRNLPRRFCVRMTLLAHTFAKAWTTEWARRGGVRESDSARIQLWMDIATEVAIGVNPNGRPIIDTDVLAFANDVVERDEEETRKARWVLRERGLLAVPPVPTTY